MLFKNPQLLYALFLLVIPILVHLFQLRRFKKEYFTNVKFLKKVQLQTRKSSQIKKWLTLLARLLALACIIIAFAQPYFPTSQQTLKEKETVIYLDNSFSMQQKGQQGELLKKAIQDLLTQIPEGETFTLLTNDQTYSKTTLEEIKPELQQINYSSTPTRLKTTYLKALNQFSKDSSTLKKFVAISDFQQKDVDDFSAEKKIENTFIQLKPESSFNVSIDSVFIKNQNLDNIELQVNLSATSTTEEIFPVSLYNGSNLMAKSSIGFEEKNTASATFSFPNNENIDGVLQIIDDNLQFDNRLYFSLQQNEKINVIALNGSDDSFLKKIYTEEEFNFISVTENQIDYNQLEDQNLIILNELKSIPSGLGSILQKHIENGGFITVIPSAESNLSSYQTLFSSLQLGNFNPKIEQELKITQINFNHPLYQNVFNKQVSNFEYPKVNSYFPSNSNDKILSFSNNSPFLSLANKTYRFSAAINQENSNFKNSPLIVPTFYNMAKQSLQLPKLYYVSGQNNTVEIAAELQDDQVIKVSDSTSTFIPLQRKYSNKVSLTFQEQPQKAGTYSLQANEKPLKKISFNYDRKESNLNYAELSGVENIEQSESISNFFTAEINANEMNFLWKWFVIFALLFLITEFLLLKFLK